MKRLFMAALALGLTAGCASLQAEFERQYCNKNGGYEKGMNDARDGKAMDASFAASCPLETSDAARGGYREGYNAGLASRVQEQPPAPGTQINVNIGGSGNGDDSRKYYCEIHAFTETFSSWGATELQAQMGAKEKCERQYHAMHCRDFNCRH